MNDTDLEMKGIKLSAELGYDGLGILKVAIAALTDANFHAEADVFAEMLRALEITDNECSYIFTVNNHELDD